MRVLLVDDQALVRSALRMMLASEPDVDVVAEAANGREAVELARRHRLDVVLMDVQMPVLDGVAATRQILSGDAADRPRVVVLTTFDDDDYVYEALRAGASGYLLKSIRPEELAPALCTVAAGDALLAPSVTRRLIARFAEQHPSTASPPPPIDTLTARERDVLLAVARGLSNREIADELVVSTTTIKSHIAHVLTKLGLRDRTQAVVLAYESGLIRPGR